jgi:Glycosyltransferase family 92
VGRDRWDDFIGWARHARAKRTFDLEERDYRLAVAGAVRELIEAADDPGSLADRAATVSERVRASIDPVVPPAQIGRLIAWAKDDAQGFAAALRSFSAAGDDPLARLESFVRAIERGPGTDQFARGGLVVASLLNFAVSPERLPIVRVGRYGNAQDLLGEEPGYLDPPADAYPHYLAFAHKVGSALRDAGVPVSDMIDVESLIAICSVEQGFWVGGCDLGPAARETEPDVYLAVCSMFRNEGAHLAEWIEFHRLVGVERFYLYDNESDDDSFDVLAPYIADGIVVRYERPGSAGSQIDLDQIKIPGFHQCIATHGAEARWIAFIDTDEFLFSPMGKPVSELLVEYERWPAVAVNSVFFGTSGHVTRPPGLVLENYTRTVKTRTGCLVKSIVDPLRVTRCTSAHRFEYTHATAVDENGSPVPWHRSKSQSFERLRINHYAARSEEDLRVKYGRRAGLGSDSSPPAGWSDWLQQAHSAGTPDETILHYLPALREALERRAVRTADSGSLSRTS